MAEVVHVATGNSGSAPRSDVTVEALEGASVLLLSGEPIDEPIVGYGPFVMNSHAEIAESFDDFHAGRFGQMQDEREGAQH